MTLRFGWEKLRDLMEEANFADLVQSYYEELSPLQEIVKLDPDWPGMIAQNEEGRLRYWTARVDGTWAGFVSFHIMHHLQYRSTLMAIDAGHYLSPAFRDTPGRVGYRIWKSAEAALRELGVKAVVVHDNAVRPLMPFFLSLRYTPRSVLYWKGLEP